MKPESRRFIRFLEFGVTPLPAILWFAGQQRGTSTASMVKDATLMVVILPSLAGAFYFWPEGSQPYASTPYGV